MRHEDASRLWITSRGSAAFLCLLVAVLVSGCGPDESDRPSREGLLAELQRNPGIPFALPRTMPSGYRMTLAETTVKNMDEGGRSTVRQAFFDFDTRDGGGSLVEVCAEEPDEPDQCGRPGGADSFARRLTDVHIVVNLHSVTARDAKLWNDTTFTTRLSEVAWLD